MKVYGSNPGGVLYSHAAAVAFAAASAAAVHAGLRATEVREP